MGWDGQDQNVFACLPSLVVVLFSSVSLRLHHLLEWGQALLMATCLSMASHMALFSSSSLLLNVGMSLMIDSQGKLSRDSLSIAHSSSQSMSQKLSLGVGLDFSVDVSSCMIIG